MSTTVLIDMVQPGVVLAEPITNTLGQTLINGGVELTAKHISLLRTWNIQFLKILDDENDKANEISETQMNFARDEFYKLLTWKPRNDAELDLIELGVISLAHRLKEKSND